MSDFSEEGVDDYRDEDIEDDQTYGGSDVGSYKRSDSDVLSAREESFASQDVSGQSARYSEALDESVKDLDASRRSVNYESMDESLAEESMYKDSRRSRVSRKDSYDSRSNSRNSYDSYSSDDRRRSKRRTDSEDSRRSPPRSLESSQSSYGRSYGKGGSSSGKSGSSKRRTARRSSSRDSFDSRASYSRGTRTPTPTKSDSYGDSFEQSYQGSPPKYRAMTPSDTSDEAGDRIPLPDPDKVGKFLEPVLELAKEDHADEQMKGLGMLENVVKAEKEHVLQTRAIVEQYYKAANTQLGFRAPLNEPRSRVLVATNAEEWSCKSLYEYYCKQYKTHVNKEIAAMLPTEKNDYSLDALNLHDNFVGDKGVLPVLEIVRLNSKLREFSIPNNGITNIGVEAIVEACLQHPNLQCIDLSRNKNITLLSARVLQYLVRHNRNIGKLNLTGTFISEGYRNRIQRVVRANFEKNQLFV